MNSLIINIDKKIFKILMLKKYEKFLLTAIIIIATQGTVIASQIISSFLMNPTILGEIRKIESIFSLLLLFTCFGMPTLTLRESAIINDKKRIFELIKKSATITTGASIIAIFLLIIYSSQSDVKFSIETKYLILAATLLIPSSITKVSSSIIQGQNIIHEYWKLLIAVSFSSILLYSFLTYSFEIYGWVLGKIIHEILFLSISVKLYYNVKSKTKFPSIKKIRKFAFSGFNANTSLIIRSIIDNSPILILSTFCENKNEIGYFGIASLIMFAPNLILSIYTQKLIPEITHKIYSNEVTAIEVFTSNWKKTIFISTVISIVVLGTFFLIKYFTDFSYGPAGLSLLIFSFFLPIKAVLNLLGGILISIPLHKNALLINIIEFLFIFTTSLMIKPKSSEEMAAIISFSLIFSTALAFFSIRIQIKKDNDL